MGLERPGPAEKAGQAMKSRHATPLLRGEAKRYHER